MSIARVFPTKTSMVPTDKDAYFDAPDMFTPQYDEVHVSVTFTWDIQKAKYLAHQWFDKAPKVLIGGVAISDDLEARADVPNGIGARGDRQRPTVAMRHIEIGGDLQAQFQAGVVIAAFEIADRLRIDADRLRQLAPRHVAVVPEQGDAVVHASILHDLLCLHNDSFWLREETWQPPVFTRQKPRWLSI